MQWEFDGFGQWEAYSSVDEFGTEPMYKIQVCEDGTFDISQSSVELLQYRKVNTFKNLGIAKSWCDSCEQARVALKVSKSDPNDDIDRELEASS
jgi:hypothetical protein